MGNKRGKVKNESTITCYHVFPFSQSIAFPFSFEYAFWEYG